VSSSASAIRCGQRFRKHPWSIGGGGAADLKESHRTYLGNRVTFAKRTYFEEGRAWWEWHQIALDRIKTRLTITFGEVATHNHFVLDRGGKVFKQDGTGDQAAAGSSEDEHLGLLGLLNSSVACFWLKQVCFPKGGDSVGGEGARVRKTLWDERYAFNATNVAEFPLTEKRPLDIAQTLDRLAQELAALSPVALLNTSRVPEGDHDAGL
jgi:hypothetical protein